MSHPSAHTFPSKVTVAKALRMHSLLLRCIFISFFCKTVFFQALGAIKSLRKHKQPACLHHLSHFQYIQHFFFPLRFNVSCRPQRTNIFSQQPSTQVYKVKAVMLSRSGFMKENDLKKNADPLRVESNTFERFICWIPFMVTVCIKRRNPFVVSWKDFLHWTERNEWKFMYRRLSVSAFL